VRLLTPRLGAAFEPDHIERAIPWWRELVGARPDVERPAPSFEAMPPLLGDARERRS
jgi:hypothetical protein